jgi:hypothetical protein
MPRKFSSKLRTPLTMKAVCDVQHGPENDNISKVVHAQRAHAGRSRHLKRFRVIAITLRNIFALSHNS